MTERFTSQQDIEALDRDELLELVLRGVILWPRRSDVLLARQVVAYRRHQAAFRDTSEASIDLADAILKPGSTPLDCHYASHRYKRAEKKERAAKKRLDAINAELRAQLDAEARRTPEPAP